MRLIPICCVLICSCATIKQAELQSAIAVARDVVEDPELLDAVADLATGSTPDWACRVVTATRSIVHALPYDYRFKTVFWRILDLAIDLCPKIVEVVIETQDGSQCQDPEQMSSRSPPLSPQTPTDAFGP